MKAFEQVFKEHYALMCSVAMDYVSDSALCQTLTEDVLLNLWEKREGLEINTSLRAYLLRAVRNKCIDHLRANRQASDSVGYYDSMEGTFGYTFADERDLFEQLVSDELEALLEQAIDELVTVSGWSATAASSSASPWLSPCWGLSSCSPWPIAAACAAFASN